MTERGIARRRQTSHTHPEQRHVSPSALGQPHWSHTTAPVNQAGGPLSSPATSTGVPSTAPTVNIRPCPLTPLACHSSHGERFP